MLHISVSSLQTWMTCKRLYYYRHIKKYEKIVYNLPFIVGRVMNEGLQAVFQKKEDPIGITMKAFHRERVAAIKAFTLSPEELEKLDLQEYITQGMLVAYRKKYKRMIDDMTWLGSEVEGGVELGDDVMLVIKMDNIFLIRKRKVLHEGKTSKMITPDYVKRIQTDFQTATYYHFHNLLWPDEPIQEVMYDVVRKPSIKQKKKETKIEFKDRVIQWYDQPDGEGSVFHIERFKEPMITAEAITNTVVKVADEMKRVKDMEDYYQDFDKCASYFGDICPYYSLCHEGGETKGNLLMFKKRESYHVSKENKGVGK